MPDLRAIEDCSHSRNSSAADQERQATTTILSLGREHLLMAIRTMVLQKAGYLVTEVYSSREALQRLKSTRFDLILICHTVPELEQRKLVAAVRLLDPGLQIVCISANGQYSTYEHCARVDNVAPAFLTELNAVLRRTGSGSIS